MSGDVFSGWGDRAADLDPGESIKGLGDSYAENSPGYKAAQGLGRGFGDWYEGPGGESATKIGLALIAMFGPGAAALGYGGGEAAGGGGGYNVASSGMDFGGEGVGGYGLDGAADYNWVSDPNSIGNQKIKGGGGFNWQDQVRQGQGMMNQSQDQQQLTGNPLLNMLLAQRYQATPFVPIAPGALYRRG